MSTSIVKPIYLDDVTFVDEAEGRLFKQQPRTGDDKESFYMFKCRVTPSDYNKLRLAINEKLDELGGQSPFIFTPDPLDGRSDEEQCFYAAVERYGRDRATRLMEPGATSLKPFRPLDCVLSGPELSLVYFRQLDPPIVSGTHESEYENIIGRTGNIQCHLIEYDNGQIHCYCSYLNLHPDPNYVEYVESGLDDGGMF